MVLVMLSSTSCLYFGGEDALLSAHPYDLSVNVHYLSPADYTPERAEQLTAIIHEAAEGRESGFLSYVLLDTSGYFNGGVVDVNAIARTVDITTTPSMLEQVRSVCVLPLSDYNRLMGTELILEPNEALIWSSGAPYPYDTFTIKGSRTLRVRGALTELPFRPSANDTISTTYYVFVPDWADYATEITDYVKSLNEKLITARTTQICSFDLPGLDRDEQIEVET